MNDWTDAERRVEKARHLFDQRKWAEALRKSAPPPASTLTTPPGSSTWVSSLMRWGDLKRRWTLIARLMRLILKTRKFCRNMGIDLHRSGQVDAAIETFQRIEAIDAAFEPSYCHRILAHSHRGEHDLAEQMFYTARLRRNIVRSVTTTLDVAWRRGGFTTKQSIAEHGRWIWKGRRGWMPHWACVLEEGRL